METSQVLSLLIVVAVQSTIFGVFGGRLSAGVRANKEAIEKKLDTSTCASNTALIKERRASDVEKLERIITAQEKQSTQQEETNLLLDAMNQCLTDIQRDLPCGGK